MRNIIHYPACYKDDGSFKRWTQAIGVGWKIWILSAVAVVLAFVSVAHAQSQPGSPANSPAASGTEAAAPIPLAEVATEAESVLTRLRDMQEEVSSQSITDAIAKQLPTLAREIDSRLRETRKIVAQKPSLEVLAGLESEWRRVGNNLSGSTRNLARQISQIERELAQLDDLAKTWQLTLNSAQSENAPADTVRRITALLAQVEQTHEDLDRERARALSVQSRVAAQSARLDQAAALIKLAREDVLKRLFVEDSEPIWSPAARAATPQNVEDEGRNSFFSQLTALNVYASRQAVRLFLHGALLIGLIAAFYWVRRQTLPHAPEEPAVARAARVFERPIAGALLLSFLASYWIHPQAPRLLWAVLGAAALVPSVVILRRFLERELHPILGALVLFYCVDQVRIVGAAVQSLPRLLFLVETFGGVLLLAWFLRCLGCALPATAEAERLRKRIHLSAWLALAVSAVSSAANLVGYVTVANFLGNALLSSAYLASVMAAMVEVLDALVVVALCLRPLALFSTVRRHRQLLQTRVRYGLRWLAIVLWLLFVLDRLLLRERLFHAVHDLLTAELAVGSLRLSAGDVVAFTLTVWAAALVSRFVRFLLEEEIYPRVNLTRGLPYAISTTLHYVILLVGLFAAVAALGLDMTKVTILAGAFSVGVGLGLQNIFNNFVSGLILLFERPVNVGDVVQIDDASGVIERIGIRASVIRTVNGSEVIVPNGKLISDRVINWTFSSRRRSIELPIAVAQGADPRHVVKLLERTAAEHPLVTRDPPPEALVTKLGPDAVGFELRAWTDRVEQWMHVRSELAIAVSAALTAEHIAIR